MNEELESYLVKKYPKILKKSDENKEHCYGLFGIECKDGWFLHLDRMFADIQSMIDYSETNYENLKRHYNKLPWYKKLMSLYKKSRYNYLRVKQTPIPQVVAVQIKEKFGTLRFYYMGGDDRITPIVDFYESHTKYICEECGSTVDVGSTCGGWIRNVCEKHAKGSRRIINNNEANELFKKIRQDK
jgi:hypothetical protein